MIYAQRINGNGDKVWNNSNPVIVCFTTNGRAAPEIANGGDSSFIITWMDNRSAINNNPVYDIYV